MGCTQFINQKPASNFHHAIGIAEAIKLPLNQMVSLNLGYVDCPPENAVKALQAFRGKLGKWVTRGKRDTCPATFVWVIERPPDSANFNFHLLVHIPASRQDAFLQRLPVWLSRTAGGILDAKAAIHVRSAPTPRGAGKYMLKGMHPYWAAKFDIEHEPQGVVNGRRSGFTKNLGPTQKRRLRKLELYPKARYFVSFRAAKTSRA